MPSAKQQYVHWVESRPRASGYLSALYPASRKLSTLNRTRYYDTLDKSNAGGDATDFHLFIAKSVKRSLLNFLETISQNGNEDGKGAYFYQRVVELRERKEKRGEEEPWKKKK